MLLFHYSLLTISTCKLQQTTPLMFAVEGCGLLQPPPRYGQPLKSGQAPCSQCVPYSDVLLYTRTCYNYVKLICILHIRAYNYCRYTHRNKECAPNTSSPLTNSNWEQIKSVPLTLFIHHEEPIVCTLHSFYCNTATTTSTCTCTCM